MRNTTFFALLGLIATLGILTFTHPSMAVVGTLESKGQDLMEQAPEDAYPKAVLAGGCFWCLESEFRAKDGVLYTRVGYIGGTTEKPTYETVSTGKTGHAEAVEITYDPTKIAYEDLVRFFLTKAHDPTQLNRQGVDVGTQYRSEIFFIDEEQKDIAERVLAEIENSKLYASPIVTKLSQADTFWLAEQYHQQYYEKYEKRTGDIHPRVFFKKKMKLLKGG